MTNEKKKEIWGKVNEYKLLADVQTEKCKREMETQLMHLLEAKGITEEELLRINVAFYGYDYNYLCAYCVYPEGINVMVGIKDEYDYLEANTFTNLALQDAYDVFKAVMDEF